MTKEFKNMVLAKVKEAVGSDMEVRLEEAVKNNDTHLTGLQIGGKEDDILPTIFLNEYFDKYESGDIDLEEIVQDVLCVYKKWREENEINRTVVDQIKDTTFVKRNVIVQLVNKENNEEYLKNVLFKDFLDLAVILKVVLMSSVNGRATVTVGPNIFSLWNMTEEELFAAAYENTKRMFTPKISSIIDILNEMNPEMLFIDPSMLQEDQMNEEIPMYSITNNDKKCGFNAMLYPEVLERHAVSRNSDLIILPASVHEILVMDYNENENLSMEDFADLIRMVNAIYHDDEGELSDHPYFYKKGSMKITIPDCNA